MAAKVRGGLEEMPVRFPSNRDRARYFQVIWSWRRESVFVSTEHPRGCKYSNCICEPDCAGDVLRACLYTSSKERRQAPAIQQLIFRRPARPGSDLGEGSVGEHG